MSDWDKYETAGKQGPWAFVKVAIPALLLILGGFWLFGTTCSVANETANVAQQQFGPRAAVVKYEWFKDAAAALDKQRANLLVYEKRFTDFDAQYKGIARSQWPRDEREAYNQMKAEYAGVSAAYNDLAAQYNSNMSKVNWQFASASLPREIAPYNQGAK